MPSENPSPKINTHVVCVSSDPILASVVSSYFNHDGYFVVFKVLDIKNEPTTITGKIALEFNRAHIINRINRLNPQVVICAGLNDFQIESCGLKDYSLITINLETEAHSILGKIVGAKNEPLDCDPKDILAGLFAANQQNRPLRISIGATTPEYKPIHGRGCLILESGNDISSICCVNLACATGGNIEFLPSVDTESVYRIKTQVENAGNNIEGHEFASVVKEIKEKISSIDFRNYVWATFLTEGIPYSLVLDDTLPTTLLLRSPAPMTIFDTLIDEQDDQRFYSGVIFTVPIGKNSATGNSESPDIARILQKNGYYTLVLDNEKATKKNFSNVVPLIPYDLLHIGTHGGGSEGEYNKTEIVDRNGKKHAFEYYTVHDVELVEENGPDGKKKAAVVEMIVPISFDGYKWMSKELEEKCSKDETQAVESLINHEVPINKTTVPYKSRIPHSRIVECYDNIHQGQFNFLASQTSPFVYNNSCCSWFDLGTSFVGIGAKGYMGTLWNIGDSTAIECARVFYESALDGASLMECCRLLNTSITDGKYKNIYILWGLPWLKIEPAHIPYAIVFNRMLKRLKWMRSSYESKASDPSKGEDVRSNAIRDVAFINDAIKQLPEAYEQISTVG